MDQINQKLDDEENRRLAEVIACMDSFSYFVDNYCFIYDGTKKDFVPFHIWPGQEEAVRAVVEDRLLVLLKARQLGMTWLCLAYALWLMNFNPHVTVLLFSLRQDEAFELNSRLEEMWSRLPDWMRVGGKANSGSLTLHNGSRALSFPTTAGDSYNATLAIVDEADLVPDLEKLMGRVKPTIDAGGKMFLVSRVDKSQPNSYFKKTYRGIQEGEMPGWASVFLPWSARPERDAAWYEREKSHSLSTTGSLDFLHEQYPATPEEALSPRSLDKRFPPEWLSKCFDSRKPLAPVTFKVEAPKIPQMRVFVTPDPRRRYTLGADPAQGNPNSDDSALVVVDDVTGEEMCNLVGKFEPAVFASHINKIALWYKAGVLVERNNHGHAVLLWLNEKGRCRVLDGPDGEKGFYTTNTEKIKAYDRLAEDIRNGKILVHDVQSYHQLSSVEAATLKAPEGEMDDRAMSWMLANVARGGSINFALLAKPDVADHVHTSKVLGSKEKIFA